MSSLLQKPKDQLHEVTQGTITGTDEEMAVLARGTQGYVGEYSIIEGSVEAAEEGGSEESTEQKRHDILRFKLYHDIKICMPVNWIGQKQVRVGEMWEEDESDHSTGQGRRRLFMRLGTEFPILQGEKEYSVEARWKKRS